MVDRLISGDADYARRKSNRTISDGEPNLSTGTSTSVRTLMSSLTVFSGAPLLLADDDVAILARHGRAPTREAACSNNTLPAETNPLGIPIPGAARVSRHLHMAVLVCTGWLARPHTYLQPTYVYS